MYPLKPGQGPQYLPPNSLFNRVNLFFHAARVGSYGPQMTALKEALINLQDSDAVPHSRQLHVAISAADTLSRLRDANGDTVFHLAASYELPGFILQHVFEAMSAEDKRVDRTPSPVLPLTGARRLLPRASTISRIPLIGPLSLRFYDAAAWFTEFSRADVNTPNLLGETPLHTAARLNHAVAIRFFIGKGASLTSLDPEGNTPLHVAIKYASSDSIEAIMTTASDDKPFLKLQNYEGYTPYLYAILCCTKVPRPYDTPSQPHYMALLRLITNLSVEEGDLISQQRHTVPMFRIMTLFYNEQIRNDRQIVSTLADETPGKNSVLSALEAFHSKDTATLHSLSTSCIPESYGGTEPTPADHGERQRTKSSTT